MKRFLLGYLIILVLLSFSCAQPISNFDGGGSIDFWYLEVVERDYTVGDNFNRDRDFYITSFENGNELRIHADAPGVKTEINPNPDSDVAVSKEVTEKFYPFTEAGKHEVLVTYRGKTKSYRITVQGIWDREDGNTNKGGLGGGIIWI